jgi:hypothetical protein
MKRLILIALLLLPSLCFGANYQAEVLVGWTGTGTHEDPYRPDWKDYKVDKYEDVTGQNGTKIPAEPNLFVALIQADNATIDLMKKDGFTILWTRTLEDNTDIGMTTPPIEPLPKQTKEELDKLLAELTAKGVPSADLAKTAMQDTARADVTGVDIAVQLKSIMKDFPAKAK